MSISRSNAAITLSTDHVLAYVKQGSTILSALVIWDATPMFWLADAEAIKIVTSDRHTFRKEVEVVRRLLYSTPVGRLSPAVCFPVQCA